MILLGDWFCRDEGTSGSKYGPRQYRAGQPQPIETAGCSENRWRQSYDVYRTWLVLTNNGEETFNVCRWVGNRTGPQPHRSGSAITEINHKRVDQPLKWCIRASISPEMGIFGKHKTIVGEVVISYSKVYPHLHEGQDFSSGLVEYVERHYIRPQNIFPAFPGDVHLAIATVMEAPRFPNCEILNILQCNVVAKGSGDRISGFSRFPRATQRDTARASAARNVSPGQEPPRGCIAR